MPHAAESSTNKQLHKNKNKHRMKFAPVPGVILSMSDF